MLWLLWQLACAPAPCLSCCQDPNAAPGALQVTSALGLPPNPDLRALIENPHADTFLNPLPMRLIGPF